MNKSTKFDAIPQICYKVEHFIKEREKWVLYNLRLTLQIESFNVLLSVPKYLSFKNNYLKACLSYIVVVVVVDVVRFVV